MQSQRSAIDVVGRSTPCFSGDAVLPDRVAPRPGRRAGSGARSARKPRSGAAWLALALGVALLPTVGQAQTVEWARSDGGTSFDVGTTIAVDAAGNSYVTGSFAGTAMFGPFALSSSGSTDIFVAKYDAGGNVLWARSAGGTSNDSGFGIAVDAAGNSYVTGSFSDTATFGSFTLTSSGAVDIFFAKYDTGGNVVWTKSAGWVVADIGRGIDVDAAGNSYVTGWFIGTVDFDSFTLISGGPAAVFVVKLDTNGNVLWAQSAGGTIGGNLGQCIAIDAAGNSYVTGQFSGMATFGAFTLTSNGIEDVFVAVYDGSGNVLWAESAGGILHDVPVGIAVDAVGNSFVTGFFGSGTPGGGTTATFGSFILTSAGVFDIFVAKYDPSGTVLWARSAGGTENDNGSGIAVDAVGSSYVTGAYQDTASFGSSTLTSAGSADIFVVKYDGSGNVVWARSAGGTLSSDGRGIAVDADGNSYVTGAYFGTATFGPFTHTAAGGADIFVAKYNTCGDDSVDSVEECDDGGESVTCDADCTLAQCGDATLNVTAGEECDGGLGCTDCLCDADFEPTAPPSLDCQPTCGNGSIDPGEECDGGLGCTDCLCDADFEPTAPPSVDCQPRCGNGSVDPGEECDGGLACTDCLCDADFEPTTPPSLDCQPTCGNGSIDPGEECDDGNTQPGDGCDENCQFDLGACCVGTACSITTEADCLDSGGSFFGFNSTCDVPDADGDGLRDECDECPDDPNKIEPGICGCGQDDNADSDGDGVPDCDDQCPGVDDILYAPDCIEAIPTVSEWGLIVMALLLLAGAKVYFNRRRAVQT